MKTKHALSIFGTMATLALIIAFMTSRSHAGYPMISGLANQYIQANSQTPVMPFTVSDDMTPANELSVSASSDTPGLVPSDGAHIILGGSGQNRTVQVIPTPNQVGTATITIRVTDTDDETNEDTFAVEVSSEPQS